MKLNSDSSQQLNNNIKLVVTDRGDEVDSISMPHIIIIMGLLLGN